MDVEITEERIDSLRQELESYGKEIIKLTQATYYHHSSGEKYDLKHSPYQMLSLLEEEVHDLLRQGEEQREFFLQYQPKIDYCYQLIQRLQQLSQVIDKLIEGESALVNCQVRQCCQSIQAIHTLLTTATATTTTAKTTTTVSQGSGSSSTTASTSTTQSLLNPLTSSSLWTIIEKECRLLRCRLINKLKRLLYDCIHIEPGKIFVVPILQGYIRSEDKVYDHVITLNDLLETILDIQAEEEVIDGLLKEVWRNLIRLLWKEKKALSPHIQISTASTAATGSSGSGSGSGSGGGEQKAEFIIGSLVKAGHLDITQEAFVNEQSHEDMYVLGPSKLSISDLLDHLVQFFSFFSTQVLSSNEKILQLLGRKMFSSPYHLKRQLHDLLTSHLPKQPLEIGHYQNNLRPVCKQFEEKITTLFFNHQDGKDSHFLQDYLNNIYLTYAQLKRKEILLNVRSLMLNDYHNIMIASSGDALEDEINLHASVSGGGAGGSSGGLMKYVHEILSLLCQHCQDPIHATGSENTGSGGIYDITNILFHTARDAIELFLAIVPIKFQEVIYVLPRMGAVFYNDCVYIIHNLILITHKYKSHLQTLFSKKEQQVEANSKQSDNYYSQTGNGSEADNSTNSVVHQVMGFMDFIPRLRKLGEECLAGHLNRLKDKLTTTLLAVHIHPEHQPQQTSKLSGVAIVTAAKKVAGDHSNKGHNAGKEVVYNNETEMHSLLTEFTTLHNQWHDVLTARIYQKLMSLLMEHVVVKLMTPVLGAECITIVGANEIQRLYRVFISRISSLFHLSASSGPGASSNTTSSLGGSTMPSVSSSVSSALSSLSASSAAALAAAASTTGPSAFPCPSWRKFVVLADLLDYSLYDIADALSANKCSAFTSKEMIKLIMALFEDTPRRQSLLDSIQMIQV
eukprot:scaffold6314_cov273-Ochromonas_danica.AAC.3